MRSSFLKRLKIKKKVILRKKRNFRHLLAKKRPSRKRRLKKSVLCFFNF
jgi:ribosomal protein L35